MPIPERSASRFPAAFRVSCSTQGIRMIDTLNLDFDRRRRLGFPEVVFAASKTVNEVLGAATRLVEAHGQVLVTRATPEALAALQAALPNGRAYPRSGCFSLGERTADCGPVGV